MEADEEFYKRLLKDMSEYFEKEEMAFVQYRSREGEDIVVLAHVQVDPVSKDLRVQPFAKFWQKNPLSNIRLVEYPILAIQKPLTEWGRDALESECDPLLLN